MSKLLRRISGSEEIPSGSSVEAIVHGYSASRYRKYVFLILFVFALLIIAGFDMCSGTFRMTILEVYQQIIDRLINWSDGITSVEMRVVWNQRMPRVLTAIIAGAGLGAAGAAMQSMMKNPLADPYTTGISSGAGFGADLAILLGITLGGYGLVANAFIFALVPAMIIVVLSGIKRASPATMILAGISVMYIFNAASSYMMLVADEQSMAQAYEWSVGTLSRADWDTIPIMAVVVIAGSALIFYLSKYLNAMNSGDDLAKTLGINVNRIRIILLLVISIVAAAIVSFTGIIGFVGMVGPHIARIFIGSDNKLLVPSSMLMGGAILIVADIISRMFTASPLPIGIVTSMIGGPIFLLLIMRQKKEVW